MSYTREAAQMLRLSPSLPMEEGEQPKFVSDIEIVFQ